MPRYAAAHPDVPVISGEGWTPYAFPGGPPDKGLLDAVVPDRPVVLLSFDGHSAWCNSAALTAAGVTAETPDPPAGRIERDAAGEPLGVFHEAARALVERLKPEATEAALDQALGGGQAYLHALGIASWLDAIVDPRDVEAYRRAAERGRLTGRAALALRWNVERGIEQVADLAATRAVFEEVGDRARVTAVKLFADGVLESSTAALLAPYADGSAADAAGCGPSLMDPDDLRAACIASDAAGFDIHVHAIGDRAAREALDGLAAARAANGARDAGHAIAHLEMVDRADLPRFVRLGVTAAVHALWALHDETDLLVGRRLDADRLERRYPFGSLRDAGATIALGSDWNVSTADPLAIMHVAMHRLPVDDPGARPLGDARERLTLEESLRAYTTGSARVLGLNGQRGVIAPGMAADLVLLDGDPFDPEVGPAGCRVRMTMVEGRIVHEA